MSRFIDLSSQMELEAVEFVCMKKLAGKVVVLWFVKLRSPLLLVEPPARFSQPRVQVTLYPSLTKNTLILQQTNKTSF